MKIASRTTCTYFFVLIISIAISFYISLFFPHDDERIIATDAINYRRLAYDNCNSPLSPLEGIYNNGLINLNWASIVIFGSVACSISSENGDYIIVGFNCFLFSLILNFYLSIAKKLKFEPHLCRILLISFLVQFYSIVALTCLNKEIFSYFAIAVLGFGYFKKSYLVIALASIAFGFIKIQFFVFGLMLIFSLTGITFIYQFLISSILLTIFRNHLNFLDLVSFYENNINVVRTEAITLWLDSLMKYPLGFLVVMPSRTILNLMAGFSPARIAIMNNSLPEFAYQLNAILLGACSLILTGKLLLRKVSFKDPVVQFIFLYLLLFGTLPFLQTRYFLPLLPIIIILILGGRSFNRSNI